VVRVNRGRNDTDRGVVPVLAVVLLIGFVAAASIGILVVGTETLLTTSSSAEDDRVESSFVQLAKDVSTVSSTVDGSRTVDFDLGSSDGAIRKEDTGRIVIESSSREEPIVNESIGAVEYSDDETTLAYQSGGVWRGTGAETRMVSAPGVHYRHGSLTMPVVTLTGDQRLTGDQVTVSKNRTITTLSAVDTVEGQLVTITIESAYYGGWADFFESRTSDTAVSVDHEAETVVVELGRPGVDGDFENAVLAQGSVHTSSPQACIEGTVTVTGTIDDGCGDLEEGDAETDLDPLDSAIDMTVESAREDGQTLSGSEATLEAGTYFAEGFHREDDLTLDVSEGDVTLVVDGHVGIDNAEIEVVGTEGNDNVVRTYTTGDVAMGGGGVDVSIPDEEASRFQLYGTSQLHFGLGQGTFIGTVYAPREEPADGGNGAAEEYGIESAVQCSSVDGEEPDVCIGQGNVDVIGSIVAGPMSVEQSATVSHDPALEGVEPTLASENAVLPPELTHLNVVAHEIDVSG